MDELQKVQVTFLQMS